MRLKQTLNRDFTTQNFVENESSSGTTCVFMYRRSILLYEYCDVVVVTDLRRLDADRNEFYANALLDTYTTLNINISRTKVRSGKL